MKRTRIFELEDIRNEDVRRQFVEWLEGIAKSDVFDKATITIKLELIHDSPAKSDPVTAKK